MDRHTRLLFSFLFLGASTTAGAQAVDSTRALLRVSVVGAQPTAAVRFRIVNSGEHVRVVGAPDLSADTLFASTPIALG